MEFIIQWLIETIVNFYFDYFLFWKFFQLFLFIWAAKSFLLENVLPLKTKEALYRSLIRLPSLLNKLGRTSLKSRRVKGIITAFKWTSALITCVSCRVLILSSNSAISSSPNVYMLPPLLFCSAKKKATSSLGLLDCCPFFFRLPTLVTASDR